MASSGGGSLPLQTLEQFVNTARQYEPLIPDAVVAYHLGKSGCVMSDPVLTRITALAAQKFVCDILRECDTQNAAAVGGDKKKADNAQEKILTSKDLAASLNRLGIDSEPSKSLYSSS